MPRYLVALLYGLRLQGSNKKFLQELDEGEWLKLLEFCDLAHLTLVLRNHCEQVAPAWVISRIDRNICDNIARGKQVRAVYSEIAEKLASTDTKHLVLKGFAQC